MSADAAARRTLAPVKWVSYAVILVSIIVLIRAVPVGSGVVALRSWIDGLGVWGPIAFGLVYVVAVVAMLPASLLTLAGGATFGLLIGTVTVSLASNVGAAIALLIARYLARGRVEQFVSNRPKFAAVDQAIDEGGWKIVAMLRLSPAVPFNVQNYLYGLTSVRFGTCVLTSWIAMLPGTFLYVYLGHAAGSVTEQAGGRRPEEWALLGFGLLATVAVTVYVTRLAQRKLREQAAFAEDTQGDPADGGASDAEDSSATPSSLKAVLIPAAAAVLLGSLAGVAHFKPSLLKGVAIRWFSFGPPEVEMTEHYANQPGGPVFDHAAWDSLLKHHVDGDGWVDYSGFQNDAARLDDYLKSLGDAPFDALGRDEKLALLINAYNAFTVRLILDHWPLGSIKEIPSAERWKAVRWSVGGNIWSLEQIEHEQIRPNFKEPRIHFALVCAAVGCPPLRNEAFTAERLDGQLEEQTQYVHAHETWLQHDERSDILTLTPLYDWYGGDFEQAAGSVQEFVARYRPETSNSLPGRTTSLPYDWSINDVANKQAR